MQDLVSIVMPNYNCGKYVEETIKSVISQTYNTWELLFVDDCSTDNSIEIVSAFNDERIKVFKNEKNSGAAESRNYALREAKGRWIAFLDSDDLWHPEKLQKQIEFMEQNGYSFSCTEYQQIDDDGKPLNIKVTGPKKITKRKMFNYCYLGCLTVMYDANIVGLIQIEPLKKRNDYAIWLKICKKATAYYLYEILASYRIRKNSLSRTSKFELLSHHYKLARIGEKMNPLSALIFTLKNIFYGVLKKVFYVKKMEDK